jgi:hypothetical protein
MLRFIVNTKVIEEKEIRNNVINNNYEINQIRPNIITKVI